jgi:catechol 2,3-dioxygenase-like lactoylglutathione lyase family enzyme
VLRISQAGHQSRTGVQLDSVQIGVEDVAGAAVDYGRLLEVAPVGLAAGALRFQLGRGAVELVPGPPGPQSLRFRGAPPAGFPDTAAGVRLLVEAGEAPRTDAPPAIDHVVVRTPDPERAIAFWRDAVGLRLALDQPFPERGLRLCFFRSGGITLEYAAPHPPVADGGPDRLWGVSYRVPDLAARRARLEGAGVDVSPIRTGMRPGTSVVTVRSHTAGVATLLLQVDAA